MSSNNNANGIVDEVTVGQVIPGEVPEGEHMDLAMLYSSDPEESEQGPKADEALQDESGNGAESTKVALADRIVGKCLFLKFLCQCFNRRLLPSLTSYAH